MNTQIIKCMPSMYYRQPTTLVIKFRIQNARQIEHCKLELKVIKYNTAHDHPVNSTIVNSRELHTEPSSCEKRNKNSSEHMHTYKCLNQCIPIFSNNCPIFKWA